MVKGFKRHVFEMLCCGLIYTAISRKVVEKNVYATIPQGNMGSDQYTVPDDCSCRTYFCCFLLALANTFPCPFLANSFKFLWKKENSKPPTMPFRIVACTFPDNLSRNSYIYDSKEHVPIPENAPILVSRKYMSRIQT